MIHYYIDIYHRPEDMKISVNMEESTLLSFSHGWLAKYNRVMDCVIPQAS